MTEKNRKELEFKPMTEPIKFYSGFNRSSPVYVQIKGVIVDISSHKGMSMDFYHFDRHEKEILRVLEQPYSR